MKFQNLFAEDEAVSPVIGVILMVAITVILAAVIGTFVLGLGDQVSNTSPSVSFSFDYDSGTTSGSDCFGNGYGSAVHPLTITHDGGDKVGADRLSVSGGTASQDLTDNTCFASGSDVTAGNSFDYGAQNDDTVRVTWQSSNGGDTATLGKWTGPQA